MADWNSLYFPWILTSIMKFPVFSLQGEILSHFPCFPCAVDTLNEGYIYIICLLHLHVHISYKWPWLTVQWLLIEALNCLYTFWLLANKFPLAVVQSLYHANMAVAKWGPQRGKLGTTGNLPFFKLETGNPLFWNWEFGNPPLQFCHWQK